ncbi:hypothetical protein TOPH_06195 [Tolypocladium ophioglossoides CBS 100239]|uniref:Uncharacterized protein n=1 Tax=Tolypocladium ophioglossoides (strain CBS 100239) TaxID=1163406 RepID=A0A0L0N5S7_TOLOC|nr:hypothetical protein TOPH_06195 [Tolypocladium ophioglossoides CBS 100239]
MPAVPSGAKASYTFKTWTTNELVAYRDTIDFLGCYQDGCGSIVGGPCATAVLAKRIMDKRAGKTMRWWLN